LPDQRSNRLLYKFKFPQKQVISTYLTNRKKQNGCGRLVGVQKLAFAKRKKDNKTKAPAKQ
jgi:hypothetical protein